MAENLSISAGVASRYASALYELARSENQLDALEKDMVVLQEALDGSDDFQRFLTSPIYTRDEARTGVMEVANYLGLGVYVKNTLGLMAAKRRLFALPLVLKEIRKRIDDQKGIVSAVVVVAHDLAEDERQRLIEVLAAGVGKEVKPEIRIDPSLIGGMKVSVGSRMIDSSIRTKLLNMKNAMQEVE